MSKWRLKLSRSFLELIFGGLGNSRAALWRRADFRGWSQLFLFIPKRLQVLNANSEIMSKISRYKDRGTESVEVI